MGIVVLQEKTFNNGLALANFVISLRGNLSSFHKLEDGTYQIQYAIYYYATLAAYTENAVPMQDEARTIILTAEQLNGNIFTQIYDELKALYPGATDC